MKPVTVTLYDDAPTYGGAERYLELLATHFDRARVAPTVVLARENALDPLATRLEAAGVPVHRLPRVPTLRAVGAFARVFGHFASRRPDILHFNLVDPRACNGAIVAARLAGHRRIVVTNQLPQSPFDDLPTPRRHQLTMEIVRHHVVVTEAARADVKKLGVADDRISVVHNCAADPGPVTPERRAAARTAIGAAPDAVVVAFAGRLVAQKNPELFIEAAAIAAPARDDLRFVLFGDGPARGALEDLARAHGVSERVKFLGHRPDAIDLYAGVDVMAFTSRYEGLPFAVLEAMALGVPVVAVRIPGMDEAVVDGSTGRLIDGGARELADAIKRLAADPAARASMGLAARARALERFSVQRMVDETTAVYARISTRD